MIVRSAVLGAVMLASAAGATAAAAPSAEDVLSFVEGWRQAWEAKDLESYMAHYAADARVGARDRAAHRAHEEGLFGREGRISVALGDVRWSAAEDGTLTVTFLQRFEAPWLRDFGRKRLVLRREDGRLLVVRESWTPAAGSIETGLAEQLAEARAPAAAEPSAGSPPGVTAPTPVEAAPPDAGTPLEPLLGEGYRPPAGWEEPRDVASSDDPFALDPLVRPGGYASLPELIGLPAPEDGRQLVEEIVARVNGRILTRSMLVDRMRVRHDQLVEEAPLDLGERLEALLADTLAATVDRWLLLQEAEGRGADVEGYWRTWLSDFRKRIGASDLVEIRGLLEEQGMTIELLKEQVIADALVQEEVTERIDRSPAAVRAYFDEHAARYARPARVSLRQVFLPVAEGADPSRALAAAREAIEHLRDGADWCDVHAVYGEGSVPCGDVGMVDLTDLAPELRDAAAGLPLEAVSKPIRSSAGWHVLQVRDRTEVEVPAFDTIAGRVEADLVREGFDARLDEFLDALRRRAVVEVNPRYSDDDWSAGGVSQ